MRSTLLLSILAFGLGGCGDHGLPSGDMAAEDMSVVVADMSILNDAQAIVTYTAFATDLAQALCAHAVACGQLDAAQMSACLERNLRHTGWDQDLEITKGRMEINELQCLDAVKNSRCDQSDAASWVTRCLQFLYIPHVANGSACLGSAECTSGYCQHAGSDAGMPEQVTGCLGSCAPFKSTSAPCRLNSDCGSDSFCDVNGTKTCTKLSAITEACTNLLGAGSGPSCQFGLTCPTFPSGSPTCIVPTMQATLHGACDPFQGQASPTAPCAAGMYCQVQYTATATACTGTTPGECGLGYCDTGSLLCQNPSGGKCENKLAKGAACDPNNEGFFAFAESQCVDGASCYKAGVQTATTCQAFGGVNADCANDTTCKVGLFCNAGKCAVWGSDSQMCTVSSHCAGGAPGQPVCLPDNADAGANTTCQQMKSAGNACNPGFEDALCTNADVAGSSYCAPSGTSGTCAPKCF